MVPVRVSSSKLPRKLTDSIAERGTFNFQSNWRASKTGGSDLIWILNLKPNYKNRAPLIIANDGTIGFGVSSRTNGGNWITHSRSSQRACTCKGNIFDHWRLLLSVFNAIDRFNTNAIAHFALKKVRSNIAKIPINIPDQMVVYPLPSADRVGSALCRQRAGVAGPGRQSPPVGCATGDAGCAPHLVAHPPLSSAHPLSHSRRRSEPRRTPLGDGTQKVPPPPYRLGRSLPHPFPSAAAESTSRLVPPGAGQGVATSLERRLPGRRLRRKRAALSRPLRLQDRHRQSQSHPAAGRQTPVDLPGKQNPQVHGDQVGALGLDEPLSPTHPAAQFCTRANLRLVASGG